MRWQSVDRACLRRLTLEFTRLRKRAKPAVAGRVQRRVRRHRAALLRCEVNNHRKVLLLAGTIGIHKHVRVLD
jgi:hypothetical protein